MKTSRKTVHSLVVLAGVLALLSVGVYFLVQRGVFGSADPGGRGSSQKHEICIDASRPIAVTAPLEVVPIGEQGELGLWIGPQLVPEAEGIHAEAKYRVHVPGKGAYAAWAYCLWSGEGHNTLRIAADGSAAAAIGGDDVVREWHWVSGPTLALTEGMHEITISTTCDSVGVRKVFLANTGVHPDEHGVVVSELFHDDFDGCNEGNFSIWTTQAGHWRVLPAEGEDRRGNLVLLGESERNGLITVPGDDWRQYTLSVSSRTAFEPGPDSAAGVCFAMRGPSEYCLLRWREAPRDDQAEVQLLTVAPGQARVSDSFIVEWPRDQWHDVSVAVAPGSVGISIDHGPIRRAALDAETVGGIGLWTGGATLAEFDNVKVEPARPAKGEKESETDDTELSGSHDEHDEHSLR